VGSFEFPDSETTAELVSRFENGVGARHVDEQREGGSSELVGRRLLI
jgi:hypothetical protein